MSHHPLQPNAARTPLSIRKIHIQNLVDLLHACLQRGEIQRATRAWSILIRCREVDWRSRWRWGLALLSASTTSTPAADRDDIDIAQWLRALRVTVPSDEKPAVLHALILHLIRQKQYREALEELEMYITTSPYLLSGPLHTYAGMLAFYLAQPASLHAEGPGVSGAGGRQGGRGDDTADDDTSEMSSPRPNPASRAEVPNASLIRQARGWFVAAQNIGKDEVAAEFIRLIDSGTSDRSLDMSDDEDEDAVQAQRQPVSLLDMLNRAVQSDEDEDEDDEDMVDTMHEYE